MGEGEEVSALETAGIKRPGFEPWLGTLCCVLGQNT